MNVSPSPSSASCVTICFARCVFPVPGIPESSRGKSHYDHVYATELFSNRSMRPAHDFVMALGSTGPCATSWP